MLTKTPTGAVFLLCPSVRLIAINLFFRNFHNIQVLNSRFWVRLKYILNVGYMFVKDLCVNFPFTMKIARDKNLNKQKHSKFK